MCGFVKNYIKYVVVFLLFFEICLRNWYFCVYKPTDIVYVEKENEHFPILSSNCTENFNTCQYTEYSRFFLKSVDEINGLLLTMQSLAVLCCNNVTSADYVYDIDFCSHLNKNKESFAGFDVIYSFESEGKRKRNSASKEIKHTSKKSTPSSNIYFKFSCIDKVYSSKRVSCDITCGVQNPSMVKLKKSLNYLTMVFATSLKVATVVVFLLVPRLQDGYGKAVMSFVLASMFREVAVIIIFVSNKYDSEIKEFSILHGLKYYMDIVTHLWQVIITFMMWKAFRFTRPTSLYPLTKWKFITISAYVWGIPFILSTCYFAVNDSMLNDRDTQSIAAAFEQAVLLTLELIAMAIALLTLVTLRTIRASRSYLEREDSGEHNTHTVRWNSVYMKIILIAGVDYVFVMIFVLADNLVKLHWGTYIVPTAIYSIMLEIYNMRGVEVFFIFVLKWDVWILLRKRCTGVN